MERVWESEIKGAKSSTSGVMFTIKAGADEYTEVLQSCLTSDWIVPFYTMPDVIEKGLYLTSTSFST